MKTGKQILLLALTSSLLLTASCGDSTTTEHTTTTDEVVTTPPADDVTTGMTDQEFVTKAAGANMAEINFMESAIKNSTNADIKKHAAMMKADHQKLGETMKTYATSHNLALPAAPPEEATEDLNDLEKMKGKDYDEKWISMAIDDHENDVELFKDNSANRQDAELGNIVSQTIPTLESHLAMCKELDDKMK